MTSKENYEQIEQVKERLLELLHYQKNRLAYRKRTEIVVEIVRQLESENNFPDADYAFDQGVLSRPLSKIIDESEKHWVTEIERSRNLMWNGRKSEKFKFVPENGQTIGQRLHSLTREALGNLLEFSHHLLRQGKSIEEILEVMMPS